MENSVLSRAVIISAYANRPTFLGPKFGPIPYAKNPPFFPPISSKRKQKKTQSEAGENRWKIVPFFDSQFEN